MSILLHQVASCNADSTATTKNNVVLVESALDESVLNRGGEEEEKDKTLMFSRELALDINSKRADLTASFILYGLYTWQVSKRKAFGYNPTIDGQPAAYRSLRELGQDYPWLAHNSILKALRRAEERLDGEFIMEMRQHGGQDQLHFLLSEKLIKKYKFDLSFKQFQYSDAGERVGSKWKREKSGLISFQRNDAIKYGTMGAILVGNLTYVLDDERNVEPSKDEAGNIYREMSPTALTRPVKNEQGEMRAPLPVSPDTITRTLGGLKTDHVFHEHPVQNNFYTLVSTMKPLEGNAAKVTTLAAKVNISAAKVNTKTEVVRCNADQMNDIQLLFVTSDSNEDRNTDGKCVITPSVSLRETDAVDFFDESFAVRKNILLTASNEAIRLSEQKQSPDVPRFDIRDYAVYNVEDTDKVRLIGYDLEHEFVMADRDTGKPYTRALEVENFMAECELMFPSSFRYTKADEKKLRTLFMDHPTFTPDMVRDLIFHDYLDGISDVPEKGHDFDFFSRKIRTVEQFLRYLPQIIREKHLKAQKTVEWDHHPVTKAPMFDYSYMEEPFLTMAFVDGKVPVTWYYIPLEEERPEVGTYLEGGKHHQFLTGQTIRVETTHVKPIYCDEFMSVDYDPSLYEARHRPGFLRYEEFLALPLLWEDKPEPREFDWVAIRNWKRVHGHPKLL